MSILPSQQSRWRWRPGVLLCVLGTAVALWFVVLNTVTAWDALPEVLHGERVDVTVTACGGGTCHVTYRLGGVRSGELLGVSSARPGAVLRATIDRDHPGSATVTTPAVTFTEALFLSVVGLAIGLVLIRGRAGLASPGTGGSRSPLVAEGDDPLAWVRRRRFGAGG